ncbi:MAG: hypothetical protein ABIH34_08155 [Nanoarchaeota archaeon]
MQPDPNLVDYIKKTHKRFPKKQIVQRLEEAGHRKDQIDLAFKAILEESRAIPLKAVAVFAAVAIIVFIGVNVLFTESGPKKEQPVQIKTSQINQCESLNEYNRNWCLFDLAQQGDREDLCQSITHEDLKFYCQAQVLKDETYCNRISVANIAQECRNIIATISV